MVDVTKEEKEAIVRRFPNAVIIRLVKHKSKRHHYCVEEMPHIMDYLKEIRSEAEGRVIYDSSCKGT